MDQEQPVKGALVADLGRGVTIREPAPGNDAWVLAHLRHGDQVEHDAALRQNDEEGAGTPPPSLKEAFVWADDDLIGRWASFQLPGTSLLDNVRVWAWETTVNADKRWRLFARMTLPVWRALWLLEDAHVTRIVECPWAGYERTLRWQARHFRQRELGRVLIGGEEHIVYEIQREANP